MRRLLLVTTTLLLALLAAGCSGGETAAEEAVADERVADEESVQAGDDGGAWDAVAQVVSEFVLAEGLNGAGLAVVHRDHGVIYEEYWQDHGPDRVSLIASSSKMISAGVLLRLHEDGALDLDAPVSDVVDWGSGNPDVTPAQLISNSSGLVGLLPNPSFAPYVCQWTVATTLQECGDTIFTTSADDDHVLDPDTTFRYGGAQWQVAGALAEAASGKSWAELLDEIYVQPCGLEMLGFANLGQFSGGFSYPAGFDGNVDVIIETANPNIEGGAFVTVPDYAALLLMHLRDGACGDTQVLTPESLDRAHGDRIGPAYDGDASGSAWGYGMGWWVDRESGRITDGGAFGSQVWLDLDDGYGVYLLIEATSEQGQSLSAQLYDLIEEAVLSH